MMGDGFAMGFGGGFMWLFWILLVVAVVWAVKALIGGSTVSSAGEETALDILKKRYANGEIDQAEFEQKRKDLM